MTRTGPTQTNPAAYNAPGQPRISVVVPCNNEEGNLRQLINEIITVLESTNVTFEIVSVDDASTDGTWTLLENLGATDRRLRAIRFAWQRGKSAALWAGIRQACGEVIIMLDADLQNPPSEMPRFLAALEGWDCVCGSRVATRAQGDNWLRRVTSRMANSIRRSLTDDNVSDSGCAYLAMRRECLARLWFFEGAHRFLPTLLRLDEFRVTEIEIGHRPRGAGQSHYGIWNRLFKTIPDLFAVRWMKSRRIHYDINATLNPPGKD